MNRTLLSLTLLASLLFPSVEGDAAKVFGPMVKLASFSLTYSSGNSIGYSGSNPADFGTLAYGAGNTRVIVAIQWGNSSLQTVTGVTVGGVALAQIAGATNNQGAYTPVIDVWMSTGPLSGSSGDVVVTFSGGYPSTGTSVGVYTLVTTTPTPYAADTATYVSFGSSISGTISVPAGGGALVFSDTGNGHTQTFAGAAIDALETAGAVDRADYYCHTTSTGSITVTGTFSGGDSASMSLVSWGP